MTGHGKWTRRSQYPRLYLTLYGNTLKDLELQAETLAEKFFSPDLYRIGDVTAYSLGDITYTDAVKLAAVAPEGAVYYAELTVTRWDPKEEEEE